MPHFDRFDICQAYLSFITQISPWTNELADFERRVSAQLFRMRYEPSILLNLEPKELSTNGKLIYMQLIRKHFGIN